MKGHTDRGISTKKDIHTEGHTYRGTYTRRDIHKKGTYTSEDIHIEGDRHDTDETHTERIYT